MLLVSNIFFLQRLIIQALVKKNSIYMCVYFFFEGICVYVTPVLKESRIFNMYVITDTGYINHTIRKTT